ncbi:MAG: hypothetical protein SGILL_000458 [Bacillariaceae sp.]
MLETFTDAIVDRDVIDYQKWSLVNYDVKELIGTEDPIIDVWPMSSGVWNIVVRQCLGVQLVHGFGLGSTLAEITTMTETTDGYYDIEGLLVLAAEIPNVKVQARISKATLLVESAIVNNFSSDSLLEMETTSSGVARTALDIPNVAASGSLVTKIVSQDFSVELEGGSYSSSFLGVTTLDDFEGYAAIEVPSGGATVFDRHSGHTSRKLCKADAAKQQQHEEDLDSRSPRMLQFLTTSDEVCGAYSCCVDCLCCGPGTEWNGNQCVPVGAGSVSSCDSLEEIEENGCVAVPTCIGDECCGEGTESAEDPTRPADACYCIAEDIARTDPPVTRRPTPAPRPTDAPTSSPTGSPTSSPTPGNGVVTCSECEEGWISQQDIIGGLECQHGPEHDNSAECLAAKAQALETTGSAFNVICKEVDPVNGQCDCFNCQGIPFQDPYSLACEGEIRVHVAWCGIEGDRNKGDCDTAQGRVNGPVRMFRAAQSPRGEACNGANGDFTSVDYCGPPTNGPPGANLACRATNCVGVGAFIIVQRDFRSVCA